jgi:cytochrome c oxidase cbb3-type subunit III
MRRIRPYQLTALIALVSVCCFQSCKREERDFKVPPPDAGTVFKLSVTDFEAGGSTTQPAGVAGYVNNSYEENAYAVSNGQTLYNQFNCVGCHSHGGGGMGPPLMDEQWIYGSRPEQVFATIVEGRPNGMPAWRNRIPAYEIWQIAAYVRSMSGLTNKNAAPGRDDHMGSSTPPSSAETSHPKQSFTPPSGEMP